MSCTVNNFAFLLLAVDCGHPPAQNDNGDVVFTGTTFTNTATYTCDSGYVQTGGNLVVFTCQANGDWSGSTAPDCTRKKLFH